MSLVNLKGVGGSVDYLHAQELAKLRAKVHLAKTSSIVCDKLPAGIRLVPEIIGVLDKGLYFSAGVEVVMNSYVDGSVYLDEDAIVSFVGSVEQLSSPSKSVITGSLYSLAKAELTVVIQM